MDLAGLYETHRHSLFRYLVRLSGDESVAEDIVHETFLRLVRRPPPRGDNIRAWLFTVASNIARDGIRERARHRRLLAGSPDRVPLGDALPDPYRLAEGADTRKRVHAMLMTLSEKERIVLLMREEGFTHSEIAEVVNTTTKSIGTVIARALRKLARRFGSSRESVT
jgi:RNA polymerase sigma-70 factor (ECF subfamily)